MRLIACLAFALFVALASSQCSSVYTCLKATETNCNYYSHVCAEGSSCVTPSSGPKDPETNDYIGTCTLDPRLGESCYDSAKDDYLSCYDPHYSGITCVGSTTNATCLYSNVAQPGEKCFITADYDNGGCTTGVDCVNGVCERPTASGGDCSGSDFSCGVDRFCQSGTGNANDACVARLASGVNCSSSRDCDPTLVCSNLGVRPYRTCIAPWSRKEAETCDNNFDCEAGLFCNGVCIKPSSYKKDFCNDNNQCQSGWDCECITHVKGNKVIEIGAKCSQSVANTKEEIKQYNKYQQCAKDNTCADYYALGFQLSTAPDTCVYDCLRKAGFKFVDSENKCFSSAGALLPVLAVVMAALVLVLGY